MSFLPEKLTLHRRPRFLGSHSCCEIRNTIFPKDIIAVPPIMKSGFEIRFVVLYETWIRRCSHHPEVAPQIVWSCLTRRQSLLTSVNPTRSKPLFNINFFNFSILSDCLLRFCEINPIPLGLWRRTRTKLESWRGNGSPKYPLPSWFRQRLLSVEVLVWAPSHERGVPGQGTRETYRPLGTIFSCFRLGRD